ncbi:exportin-7-A isoform X1 [Tanacetum coccineum]
MESLAQLEALCERLYNSQDSAERAHAENTLKCFSANTDYISQCQYILDNASTPYALMLASSSLLKQVTEHTLSLQLRLDIRNSPMNLPLYRILPIWNYIITYLAKRGHELQPYVIGSLVQLLCRVTKFGWFDDDRFRDAVKDSTNFLIQASPEHVSIGLKILNQLVSEMNQPNPGLPSTHHRRVACSFRDQNLYQVFQISLTSLQQLKSDVGSRLQELALSLALKCLSYDFVGTSIDESSDEFGTVQALECLVRLASVRRSLFSNDAARSKFLAHLMTGCKEILQAGQGLKGLACSWAVLELANGSYMIFAYEHLESFRHMAGQRLALTKHWHYNLFETSSRLSGNASNKDLGVHFLEMIRRPCV